MLWSIEGASLTVVEDDESDKESVDKGESAATTDPVLKPQEFC